MADSRRKLRVAALSRGQRWRATVVQRFELRPDEEELVELAAAALDRHDEAERALRDHGVLVEGRFGPRANPACAVVRDAAATFSRACRQLGFRDEAEPARNAMALPRRRGRSGA